MILYKYFKFELAMMCLESNKIKFSHPSEFNDPFETTAGYTKDNPFRNMMLDGMGNSIGILSLTRTPLNPLMWAHYAESHTGIVVGIDCSIDSLTSEDLCIIPAQYGGVIYANTKPEYSQVTANIPNPDSSYCSFSPTHLEDLQRQFLYKPMCWSYEEEVRVVKNTAGNSDLIAERTIDRANPLHMLQLPQEAIKEIYIGIRAKQCSSQGIDFLIHQIRQLQPSAQINTMKADTSNWHLNFENKVNQNTPDYQYNSNL